MLIGTFNPKVDEKGRLFLPAKFRDEFKEGLVMMRGQERCLYVYTHSRFQRVHDLLAEGSITDAKVRAFRRSVAANAHAEEPDKQGRITIPPGLREYARISKDVAVVGNITNLEIWDKAEWEAYQDAHESDYAEIDEEIIPGL